MSSKMQNIVNSFVDSIRKTGGSEGSYDTSATVKRVENGIAYVSIPGGTKETPVKLTMDAKPGDEVQVRVSGHRAWLQGNATAPPTDDTTAMHATRIANTAQTTASNAQDAADEAQKEAGNAYILADTAKQIADDTEQHFWFTETGTDTGAHIAEVPKDEWEDSTNPNYHSGGNLLARSNGIAVRQGMTELASFGASGAIIGIKATGQGRAEIDSNGLRVYRTGPSIPHDDTEIGSVSYGEVVNQAGTTTYGNYYTFGHRTGPIGLGSTVVGSQCKASGEASYAEGHETCATGLVSHAEGISSEATKQGAHAEGSHTHADGHYSHSEGYLTYATGDRSHAQNYQTKASSADQTVLGKNNVEDANDIYAVIVGNGTADDARSNAIVIDWSGNVVASGTITDGSNNVLSSKLDKPTSSTPLYKIVPVQKTFNVAANSYSNQAFAPASADVPSGYTRVGLASWNTASTHVFISTCTGTTITFCNKSSSQVTCTNATINWLYIKTTF